MGLLDDAIREHLELKRKHGADPAAVDREIEEALGPPQRAEFAEAPEGEAPEAPAAEAPPAPADEPAPAQPLGEEEPFAAEPEPEPDPEPAPPESEPFDVESLEGAPEPAAPREEGEEDVLQDTPDFLQETPEHDRLWFEQRPPRDFDWDK